MKDTTDAVLSFNAALNAGMSKTCTVLPEIITAKFTGMTNDMDTM